MSPAGLKKTFAPAPEPPLQLPHLGNNPEFPIPGQGGGVVLITETQTPVQPALFQHTLNIFNAGGSQGHNGKVILVPGDITVAPQGEYAKQLWLS